MGALLWALVGGGFPFLWLEEEFLDRAGNCTMARRILRGAHRPLPEVCRAKGGLLPLSTSRPAAHIF